jgi:hypothetical protein
MSNHTPGPWRVDGFADGTGFPGIMHEVFDDNKKCIRAAQIIPFYDCDPNGKDYSRHMADKRLIEAAPELLAAMMSLDSMFDNDGPLLTVYANEIKAFRAAISKATQQ